QVLIALMPVVLAMLSNRGGAANAPTPASRAASASGGIGDGLAQVFGRSGGGARGAGGGLRGLLDQLQRSGFGAQAGSWVSRGANKEISPDAMAQIFGKDGLDAISRHAGISRDEASNGLSALLPELVDRMTPDGKVPDQNVLANNVDDFLRRHGLS